jgi:hypothetical protein
MQIWKRLLEILKAIRYVFMTEEQKIHQQVIEMIDDIDNGFNKFGRSINNPTIIDRYLLASTYKAVRFCKSILLLCHHGFADESMSVLRSLVELSLNMRWIMEKDTKARLKEYMTDLGKKGFGAKWTDRDLFSRIQELGFGRDYYDFCIKPIYSYAHVNSSSLRWGEVIDHPQLSKDGFNPEAVYQVVAQMLGHIMKSLDTQYKGCFPNYNKYWKKIKGDNNVRAKINKIIETLEKEPEKLIKGANKTHWF